VIYTLNYDSVQEKDSIGTLPLRGFGVTEKM